jgi:uncharacterized protein (TIGR04222 family)
VRSRPIRSLLAAAVAVLATAGIAVAQQSETIHGYRVTIEIRSNGDVAVTERIDYDFGLEQRHGIVREIPTRVPVDDRRDRLTPIQDVEVSSPTAPTDVNVSEEGGVTTIRIGDPDRVITGRHVYVLSYRVIGALNGFRDHDELYWNAIGTEWSAPIERAIVTVRAPAQILRFACFQGPEGSMDGCGVGQSNGSSTSFRTGEPLQPFEGMTFVISIPKGAVPDPTPILVEKWSFASAFSVTPITIIGSLALLAAVGFVLIRSWSREGRDRVYVGSPVDQVLGSATGEDQPVSLSQRGAEAPVEFAPPDDIRPGQIGTLIDERANVVDVTATIVDLAGRGYLVIHEIPDEGWFSKVDWKLAQTEKSDSELLPYEKELLEGLFRDGNEVAVSDLKATFSKRLLEVERALYQDATRSGWFRTRPDKARTQWAGRGLLLALAGGALTFALAAWTSAGLLGIPVLLGGLALSLLANWMPARTAKGTGMLRRVRGFRRVIETAETHMARWAEQENVFTRYLPYAVVFGLTEKWAKAFEDLGLSPDTSGWYVGQRPFTALALANSIDSFSVRTGGTLASTPAASGSSGFGGGGFSGGGGGGGGGGSW